jgi:hypothetical protein
MVPGICFASATASGSENARCQSMCLYSQLSIYIQSICLYSSASGSAGVETTQTVVSVTERTGYAQTWYNRQRTRKPQTFQPTQTLLLDPTDGGRACDFCASHIENGFTMGVHLLVCNVHVPEGFRRACPSIYP